MALDRLLTLALGCTLLASTVPAHGQARSLDSSPWTHVSISGSATALAVRPDDTKLGRQRFHYDIKSDERDLAGQTYNGSSLGLVAARTGRVVVAPRVLLNFIGVAPAKQPAAKRTMEAAYRRVDQAIRSHPLLVEQRTGVAATLRIRPIFVTDPARADWKIDIDNGTGRSDESIIHLNGPSEKFWSAAKVIGHEIGHSAFGAPDEYAQFIAKPIMEGGSVGAMTDPAQPLMPHSLKPFLDLVQGATAGRFVPAR